MESKCVMPKEIRGVRMGGHSDDLVEVYYGAAEPLHACGFHARYYLPECIESAKAVQS